MKMDAGSAQLMHLDYTVICHSFADSWYFKLRSILSMQYTARIYIQVEVGSNFVLNICVICMWVDRFML
jgi:hypothetical protein